MKIRIHGTEVDIGFFFISMIAMLLIVDKTGLMSMSLIAAVVHECGHLIALAIFGRSPRKISLRVGRMSIVPRGLNVRLREAIIVSLAGPLANLIVAMAFIMIYTYSGHLDVATQGIVMAATAFFSLLPILGLDGGDVICCVLCFFFSKHTSKQITLVLTIIFLIGMAIIGIKLLSDGSNNPTLLIVALYLFIISIMGYRHSK